ncbi:hypothetical protein [Neobacillus sp.]|uniref:hypothetical protein n=1 Tax=Neobacillus sp. TaxID=2675273 RepID=UPI0035B4FAFD
MKNTKSNKKDYSSIAAQMIKQFIESGKYPQLKQAEKKIKILTSSMKERLEASECKRHVFKKLQLVGRFVAKPIYETDTVAINEYLLT